MKVKYLPFILVSLVFIGLIIPFSIHSLSQMTVDTSINEVMGSDQRSQKTFDKFDTAFGHRTAVIAVVKIDGLFSNKGAQDLYDISEALESMPDLKDIKSLTHSSRPVLRGFKKFFDGKNHSEEEWQKIKKFLTEYPMTKDILVSADGNYALIIAVLNETLADLETKKQVMKNARDRVQPFVDRGIEVKFLSEPFITAEFHDLIIDFIIKFILISLLMTATVILLTFRSPKILLLMLTYQAGGFLVLPIVFYFNRADVNVYSIIVIPLVSAIQLTFLTHFYSVFQECRTGSLRAALRLTLALVLKPSLIALTTSVIGMGALYLSEVSALQGVGRLGMMSLIAIFVITFLPAICFAFFSRQQLEGAMTQEQESEHRLMTCLSKARWSLVIVFILLGGFLFSNYQKISTDIRAKEFLSQQSETRQALDLIDTHFGGINIFQLEVTTGKSDGIQEYEFLQYLHQLRNKALKVEGVRDAYTYSQFYTTANQIISGNDMSNANVLPTEFFANICTAFINRQKFPFQSSLQNADRSETVFILRTGDLPSSEFLKIVEEFQALASKNLPKGVKVSVKNGIHSILDSDRKVVKSQSTSITWSLISVFVCLLIMWRSIRLSSVAVICNLLPLLSIGLLMLFLDIPLNSITVMVSSIVFGIAVDDSIHFLSYYKGLDSSLSNRSRVSAVLHHKLKPMICTSSILIICMSLFMLAPFPPISDFGLLGALSLLVGLFSSCIFLPTLLLMKKE